MLSKEANIIGGRVINVNRQTLNFQGLTITIENDEGTIRNWKNGDGEKGKSKMLYAYGFINGTIGVDGEEIDCFIGNDKYSPNAYIVKLGRDDREEKIMLGFSNLESARDAFLAQYLSLDFLGDIIELPMHLFKETLEYKGR